ncbi:MAG TPA: T9SS type A sorting domain-containing protein [Flavobacteriales bacterium]|jgi:hypothetical protein|nr:T9SS type A sorting domain-containing protein [Flavobacteriales bacterium]MBP9175857.1 T9SS type A sorting domain-containing protein [Flavobacteriales bacterium]HQW07474.1 T9SS type A sorting domain-containing protein [Flavobacteriales bacterium]HQX00372.1 T9SS type A sorting domain-containing protein [Flavobacteriales bacterium]HQY00451.1 T9SS type A sorting domain-containing protein [Flavobacteriales bacterium]
MTYDVTLVVLACSMALTGTSQIVVDPMDPIALCGSPTLNVSYEVMNPFDVGNVFNVELSDASGSFAAPTLIGSIEAVSSGSVACTFPAGISAGSGIAIRIVATDPPETGATYILPITTVVPVNAGYDDAFTVCSTAGLMVLIDQVGGMPDLFGSWTDSNGVPHSGILDPAADPSGFYTYRVEGIAPCATDLSLHFITIVQGADAGTSTTATICSSDAPFLLSSLLGGSPQPGGTWTFNSVPHNPLFVPGADAPGCYGYTVTANAPCSSATTVVCVQVNLQPDAGTDGGATFCANEVSFVLFPLLGGSPHAGGTWTFLGILGQEGCYQYVVAGDAPCVNDTSMVCISFAADIPPDAGISADIVLCANGDPVSMTDLLDGTPDLNGTWTSIVGAPHSGLFDPAMDPEGCYEHTVMGSGPCADTTATLCITLEPCLSIGAAWADDRLPALWVASGWNTDKPVIGLCEVIGYRATLELVDAIGRVLMVQRVASPAGPGTITVDLSAQPTGIYTLVFKEGGRRHTLRISKI